MSDIEQNDAAFVMMEDNDNVDFSQCLQLYRQRDMAQAYIRITQEMGPSKQLIAFINYDNNLSQEVGIGLESFELENQHELLLQHLDVDVMDQIATESFMDKLKKYRWLLAGGSFGVGIASIGLGTAVGLHTLDAGKAITIIKSGIVLAKAMLAAGAVGIVTDTIDKLTIRYNNFTEYKKQFEGQFTRITAFITSVPTNSDNDSWEKFEETFVSNKTYVARPSGGTTVFRSSGWNESNYMDALRWLEAQDKNMLEASKKLATKIEALENKIKAGGKGSSAVASTIFLSTKLMNDAKSSLMDVKKLLNTVGHHFEPKEK